MKVWENGREVEREIEYLRMGEARRGGLHP